MNIIDFILRSSETQRLPVAVYPGLLLSGGTVREITSDWALQLKAIKALQARYKSPFALTAMDLSVEAENFGAKVLFSENEVPTIDGRLLTNAEDIEKIKVPSPDKGRGIVQIKTLEALAKEKKSDEFILGGLIGPYSLAGRLFGISEFMEITLLEPEAAHCLIKKAVEHQIKYAKMFKEAGADAVFMAEPAAGLLWPEGLRDFSSVYVKEIAAELEDENFKIILHNCGCTIEHLDAVLASGISFFHFGKPTDVVKAVHTVPDNIIIAGNLDPMEMFVQASVEEMKSKAEELLSQTADKRNFVLSSGCDIPPNAKLANLDAFYAAEL